MKKFENKKEKELAEICSLKCELIWKKSALKTTEIGQKIKNQEVRGYFNSAGSNCWPVVNS